MTRRTLSVCLLSLAAIPMLSGCAIDNDRLTLGPHRTGADATLATFSPPPALESSDAPSSGLADRSTWKEVDLSSPFDLTESWLPWSYITARDNRRNNGDFPTTDTALDVAIDYNGLAFAPAHWQRAPNAEGAAAPIPAPNAGPETDPKP